MTEKDNKKHLKYEIHQPFLLNISIEMWSCFCCFPHPNTMILHFVSFETIFVYRWVYILHTIFFIPSQKTKSLKGDYSFDWHSAFHWDGKSVDLAKLNGDIYMNRFPPHSEKAETFWQAYGLPRNSIFTTTNALRQKWNPFRVCVFFFLFWSFPSCQLPVSRSYKHFTWKCKLKIRLCVCGLFDCVFQHRIMCFTYGLRLASNIVGSY